ncbi:hypothetical protein ACOL29_08930 [Aliarcobacter butzleri]
MNHNKFILSPVSNILKDVVSASSGIGDGIETYPLCDYVMQSVFLKMTGAQEQKMKCIVWELATNDYDYRYERFTKSPLGECSNYTEKKIIYNDLIKQIEKYMGNSFDMNAIDKNNILKKTNKLITDTFLGTNLLIWTQMSFNEYKIIWNDISDEYFAIKKELLLKKDNISSTGKALFEMYEEHLYKHRNRVAHNTLSYQQNLPTLNTLEKNDYLYNNYFIYFSIIILIDNIIISLYNEYLKALRTY